MDIVSKKTRSRMMAGIKGKNTKPELLIRKALHALGYRYVLHGKLTGRPDLVFPKRNAVIFINGCFWHKHDCHLFKWPSSREEFWKPKLEGNCAKDEKNLIALKEQGWRVGVIWECAIKGKTRMSLTDVVAACDRWLKSNIPHIEIKGL